MQYPSHSHNNNRGTPDPRFSGPNGTATGPDNTNIYIMQIKKNNHPKKDSKTSFAYLHNMYNESALFTGPKKTYYSRSITRAGNAGRPTEEVGGHCLRSTVRINRNSD